MVARAGKPQVVLRARREDRPAASGNGGNGGAPRPSAPRPSPPRSRRPRPSVPRRIAYWVAVLLVWIGIGGTGLIAYYAYGLPDIRTLEAPTRRAAITLVTEDGNSFATFGDLVGDTLRLEEMPSSLPLAVLATEDRRFNSHPGIDPIGLARAMVSNIRSGYVRQGGSTITQQLAKNLFLTSDRTIKRKVQETLLALWLERKFTKAQILTLYLNRMYMGAGAYGVDAAARRYFGKSARQIDLWQSAMLAGVLKAPSRFNPMVDPEAAQQRTRRVLSNMVDAGYLTQQQVSAAHPEPGKPIAVAAGAPSGRYFADWVMDQVPGFIGITDRDLVVVTTLNPALQRLAEGKVALMMDIEGAKVNAGQAALVTMTPDGAVRAMVGGVDYQQSQFNRATQALRQPGSAFKPVVYLAAMQAGFRPGDRFIDAPVSIGNWQPKNYDGQYHGEMTLREGLAQSINTIAAQLVMRVGPRRVVQLAERMGITSPIKPDASLALGSYEVTPLELTAAYAAIGNGGDATIAYGIKEIRDTAGAVLYRRQGTGIGRVAQASEIMAMDDMMSAAIATGTGKAAKLDRPVAGKTGTTSEYRDAWFLGFTADLVTGVWVGNDDNKPMKNVTGGTLPARIWREFMLPAHAGLPARPLLLPAAVVAQQQQQPDLSRAALPGYMQPRGSAPATREQMNNPEYRPPGFSQPN